MRAGFRWLCSQMARRTGSNPLGGWLNFTRRSCRRTIGAGQMRVMLDSQVHAPDREVIRTIMRALAVGPIGLDRVARRDGGEFL